VYIIFPCTYKFHLYIIQILLIYSSTDKPRSSVVFHLCIFKPTFFMYIFSLYISKNSFFSKTNFYLYITQILFENTFYRLKFDLSFYFICTNTLNTIGIERNIIPCENTFKINGPLLQCKSQPSYVHPSLSVHKYSFVYIFTSLYTVQLVNNQVTLVSNVRSQTLVYIS